MNLVPHRLLFLHNFLQVQEDIDENDAFMGQLIQQIKIQRERKQRRWWVNLYSLMLYSLMFSELKVD